VVVDDGNFFSDKQISDLESKMQEIENKTTVQTLIYTIMDLNGMAPMEYALEIGKKYKNGVKGVNNGILILLSKNDRNVVISNGYGIEWIISDYRSQIIIDQMVPFFKKQNFYGGVKSAFNTIEYEVSKIDWTINETELDNISENHIGEILKFEYTNEIGNAKYNYALETDSQFSEDFKIVLELNQKEFELYYSKNMNDMISPILNKKNIVVYARLTDWTTKRLELLGIE
jgi:hypothetical protein